MRVVSAAALREGFIASGRLEVTTRTVGPLQVHVATHGPRVGSEHARIARLAGESLGAYARVFGGTPRQALGVPYRHVILLLADESNEHLAGGGLAWKDIALLVPPDAEAHARLESAVTHELFHLWNARAFRYRTTREAWFSEGVTEYYAQRSLRDLGRLDDSGYRHALESAFERYRHDPWIASGSIALAGEHKFRHRALVYDGGMLLGACLDADIRRASKGTRGLDDLMRAMYARFDAGEKRYDNAAIYALVTELADDATGRALNRAVDGSAPLSLWRCATETGP
jgi:predicted metalloprotease with PDZ domain